MKEMQMEEDVRRKQLEDQLQQIKQKKLDNDALLQQKIKLLEAIKQEIKDVHKEKQKEVDGLEQRIYSFQESQLDILKDKDSEYKKRKSHIFESFSNPA